MDKLPGHSDKKLAPTHEQVLQVITESGAATALFRRTDTERRRSGESRVLSTSAIFPYHGVAQASQVRVCKDLAA